MPIDPTDDSLGVALGNDEGNADAFFKTIHGSGYNDMIALPTLTQDSILDNLSKRFKQEIVYTYIGDIVVSVNPFKKIGNVGKSIRAKYKGATRTRLPPHIYALVDHAYNEMLRSSQSQSVLISGESGAGKTEAMKISLTYIGEISADRGKRVTNEVSSRLMQTNPVMEALGNAKTVRNNNSSRFGKHFDIQFSDKGIILGAVTSVYLLEKPRICTHLQGERNYHVFYMLCKAPAVVTERLGLSRWQDYKICNQQGTAAEVHTWNDIEEFDKMHSALLRLGFNETDREQVYCLLAFVLLLGNVEFKPGKEGSEVKDSKAVDKCAALIKVTSTQLIEAITLRTLGGGKLSTYKVPLEPRLAVAMRNSLAMHVYALVFDWCVAVINEYMSAGHARLRVGLLDIFGFENFALNSFPQLCINFTNESLHNLFIEHVFKLEQEVYEREEVEWNFVAYEDNQHIIDLISKRPICLFSLLDEGCQTGPGKDSSVLDNYHSTFTQPKYPGYIKPKKSSDRTFVLRHYAGEVVYAIEGWVERNKDELSHDVSVLIELQTGMERLATLAQVDKQRRLEAAEAAKTARPSRRGVGGDGGVGGSSAASRKKTVAKSFSESLGTLMERLKGTEHHYIRCLKPNQTLSAGDWDAEFMLRQLAYSGALEVTQIRKAGLNVRRPLKHFYQRYKICANDPTALRAGTLTKRTELLLRQLSVNEDTYRVGKTLLFLLSSEILEQLDEIRELRVVEYVIRLQSFFRMFEDYRRYHIACRSIRRLQGFCVSWEIRRAYKEVRAAAILLCRWTRCNLAHEKLLEMRDDKENSSLTVEEKREVLLKILYPDSHGRGRVGLSGTRRRQFRLQPARVAGDGDDELAEMPKFAVAHEGWLRCKVGSIGKYERRYVSLKQGTLTLYPDATSFNDAIVAFNMAVCTLHVESSQMVLRRSEKLFMHKVRSLRQVYRRVKAPLLGTDSIVFEKDERDANARDVTAVWAEKMHESILEARLVDGYKMQVNDGGDDDADKPVNQKEAAVIREGYLRKKKPGNSAIQDLKRAWERRYFVLTNDGKLRYYDSKEKVEEKGSLDLRFFSLVDLEEDMELDEDEESGDKQALKVQGQFFKIMKGKQFALFSGKHAFYMASPEREVCDDWISTLQTTLSILYQKSPLFSQDFLRVYLMDDAFSTIPLDETTKARDVLKLMCKKHALNNESEWGLLEQWDHPGIEGNVSERKIPSDELIIDQTLLQWERAARKKFGMVSLVPLTAFKLVMRKVSSLLPQARTKKEQQLEYCQARNDIKDGRFMTADVSEMFDLAALAIFKDFKDGMSEEEQEEELVLERGQLSQQLHHYLPHHWFKALANKKNNVRAQQLEDWERKVLRSYYELIREELLEKTEMSKVRKIVHSFRMEAEVNALAAGRMLVERVRLAPLCFSAQYSAEMWSVDKILKVFLVLNAGGLHVYRPGGASPLLLSSFGFDVLVSWQSMNDTLILNVLVQSETETMKRREKLRFLTPESSQIRALLSKYAESALAEWMRRQREKDAVQRQLDDDDAL